ncbi:Glycerol-3-phosphate/dihydroxyacetone phosphate acyltransferase [Mucor velutinosus]|uniref:Glycerol-3-phosphate/dihydroxyacetone phosphate acyltransferase n=1 Tax=Mucor velutinosus TaxID=708070 RepID=A0AAN7HVC4_9FUNG|nr:Glycerol-3-phosphate/dihydroxyacetone phosphate acyltransferase [Mucor velutinosus]
MTSKVGQWKPRSRLYEKDLEKDSYFKEIFVEDALLEAENYRRSSLSEDEQSSTGMSSDGELLEEPEPPAEEMPLKAPHRIPLHQRNVTRIKRSVLQKFMLAVKSVISALLSFPILFFFVTMAVYTTGKQQLLDKQKRIQESDEDDMPDELLTQDETYYAERWGYTSEMHEVVTQDGYILKMYRINKKGSIPRGKPVLIGHGLFQCSGAFVLNEQRSLAFTLIDQGYDVWVGNNRSIAGLDHVSLSFKDPEYWNWGLKELGIYDFAAMLDHVKLYSNSSKVAYIGHSQGNAQAFIALSLCPEIADNLSCFIALAPAVFSGNLVNTFPLNRLINLSDWFYSLMFGTGSFLPVMSFAQTIVEPRLFCFLAYSMFSYLFSWWDSHWLRRRKAKYFQFTPRPVSSRLIADWIAGWGRKGVCLYVADQNTVMNTDFKRKVPLVVFYGTADYLVNGERFVRTFPGYETHGLSPEQVAKESTPSTSDCQKTLFPMLDLVHVERVDGYEHMDTIWGHDNHKTTYPIVLKNLENARWE